MHVTGHMGRLVFAVCCIQLILFGVLGAQSKDEPGISQDGMFIDFDLLSQDPIDPRHTGGQRLLLRALRCRLRGPFVRGGGLRHHCVLLR